MRHLYPTRIQPGQIIALLALLFVLPATYADTPANTEGSLPGTTALERLDERHKTVSHQVTRFANWIDNFFANDLAYDELQESHINLGISGTFYEDKGPGYDLKLDAKLSIPKTQKRVQLLIESYDKDEEDLQKTSLRDNSDNQDQSIGLRFLQKEVRNWRVITDAGLRFRSGIDTFARLRLKRSITRESLIFRLQETIFWFDSDGMGETTRLDVDRNLTKKVLIRSTSQATWRNKHHFFDLGQEFSLFQNIDTRKAIAYQTGVRAVRDPEIYATDYVISIRYREQIYKKWLYMEINPKINYPQDNDYKPVRSITLKMDAIFGAL